MDNPGTPFYYPNRMARIIFLAAEEILGRNGVNAVSNLAGLTEYIEHYPPNNQNLEFSFRNISHFQRALVNFYGPHAGKGVALRIGRACFHPGLHEFAPLLGMTDMAFRLLPLNSRLSIGSSALCDIFNKHTDQRVHVEDKEKTLLWHIDRCPLCWEHESHTPACHMAVGVIQEALYWVSGGKFFNVEETLCIAKGDATCTIVIDKTPVS
ncbi:MAG: 4-vinyl reductase [Chloroflexota bacterium]